MLAKRYLNQGKETEEQFRERVKECVHLFQEAQASNLHSPKQQTPPTVLRTPKLKS